MKKNNVRQQVLTALSACEAKKADDLNVLELEKAASAFTDYFVICSGSNPRQIQAISDEVEQRLAKAGLRPAHVEGYHKAEWVLLDYVDFVVHVFSPAARNYYDLERLWKSAKRLTVAELAARKARPKAASGSRSRSGRRAATKRPRTAAKKRVRRAS